MDRKDDFLYEFSEAVANLCRSANEVSLYLVRGTDDHKLTIMDNCYGNLLHQSVQKVYNLIDRKE